MKYFIIGDVHACLHTYKYFLKKYWNPQKEILIQVGDIANKGSHTFETLLFSMELSKKYPENFIQLKGNNEHILQKALHEGTIPKKLIKTLEIKEVKKEKFIKWLTGLPHFWENDAFFVSHAGIDKNNSYPVRKDDLKIIYTRENLKNIGKAQFVGHVFVESPFHNTIKNIWYLDTGTGLGKKLSGVKVKSGGSVIDIISTEVKKKDFEK